jgi:hypothetical protein
MEMKKKWLAVFQIIGVAGFAVGVFQFTIGFFIGFLCTGLYFMLNNKDNVKSPGMATGIIAFCYSFYSLTF